MEEIDTKNVRITAGQQMISSCMGSMVTSVMVTPLDVVKVRLQAQQKMISSNNKCFLYCSGYIEDLCCQVHADKDIKIGRGWPGGEKLTGTLSSFLKISRAEGITALWSGLPTTLAMAIPATVIYFTLYDQLRYKLASLYNARELPIWVPVVSGATARFVCVTAISPLEMIRTKMQSTRLSYREIHEALRTLIRNQGVLSLWHGVGPTYWRDIPFSALYWTNYELLKKLFQQETPTWSFSFTAGAMSGTIAAIATLPFDVIKTHLQVQLGETSSDFKSRKATLTLLRQLYQKNGYKSLFVGLVPRVVKIAPACAIMISSYEYGKQYFRKQNADKAKQQLQSHKRNTYF